MRYLQIVLLTLFMACTYEQESTMDKFQNLATVVINLDELETTDIPVEIGELTQATSLTIQLTQPEGAWVVLPPLSSRENSELKEPFRTLPESIGNLKNIQSLRLSHLDIHELPESIGKLDNLEFLDLSFNKIDLSKELPKIEYLAKLNHLRIVGNRYKESDIQQYKQRNPQVEVVYKY